MSPTASTATSLRLNGVNLPVARGVFVILSLGTVIFFSMGVPLYYESYLQNIKPETVSALQGLGLSTTFYAAYQTVLVVLLAIAFAVAGIIISWFKSDEWLALLVAFTLIGQGANAFGPLQKIAARATPSASTVVMERPSLPNPKAARKSCAMGPMWRTDGSSAV